MNEPIKFSESHQSLAEKLRQAGYAESYVPPPEQGSEGGYFTLGGLPTSQGEPVAKRNPAGSAFAVYVILLVFFVGAFALASIPLLVLMFLIKAIL